MALGGAGSFLPMQQTPTSIVWSHDTWAQGLCGHSSMFFSNPLQRTPSSQMGPFPFSVERFAMPPCVGG